MHKRAATVRLYRIHSFIQPLQRELGKPLQFRKFTSSESVRKYRKKQTTSKQEINSHNIKNDIRDRQALTPSINNTNIVNNKTIGIPPESNQLFEQGKKENSSGTVEESGFKKPHLSEVKMYFAEKDAPSEEAEKFFDHYESNGWLVGGKSKMKNWQAAARNWLMNSKKFNISSVIQSAAKNLTTTKNSNLNATTGKSYREPL